MLLNDDAQSPLLALSPPPGRRDRRSPRSPLVPRCPRDLKDDRERDCGQQWNDATLGRWERRRRATATKHHDRTTRREDAVCGGHWSYLSGACALGINHASGLPRLCHASTLVTTARAVQKLMLSSLRTAFMKKPRASDSDSLSHLLGSEHEHHAASNYISSSARARVVEPASHLHADGYVLLCSARTRADYRLLALCILRSHPVGD